MSSHISNLFESNTLTHSLDDFKPEVKRRIESAFVILPPSFPKILNLDELDIDDNEFQEILSFIIQSGKASTIRTLSCCGCPRLTKIPPEIEQFMNVDYIEFLNNNITTIANEISNCVKLEHLDLHQNQLTTIPNGVCNLKKLRFLDLCDNKIKTIPKIVGNMQNLRALYLEHNLLATIPHEITKLRHLRTLDVSENNLLHMPCAMLFLKHLYADEMVLINQQFLLDLKLANAQSPYNNSMRSGGYCGGAKYPKQFIPEY